MRYLWMLALLLLSGGACFLRSLDSPEPPVPVGWVFPYGSPIGVAWSRYNKIVQGTVIKVTANWDDDDPCGIFQGLRHQCTGTRAYSVVIKRLDGGKEYVEVFVQHDDFNPLTVGLAGTFLLTRRYVLPLHRCRELAPQYSSPAACASMGRMEFVILSTDDVLPIDAVTP